MPFVTDTHALIWHLTGDSHLSPVARNLFRKADTASETIVIPCIVFFELVYLLEKQRVPVDFVSFTSTIESSSNYQIEPLCLPIIRTSHQIPREKVPDPWDRIIAATAIHRRLPLISRDSKLASLNLPVVW
jgi:PIN domain nuclease of toxin-antitoxin system